VARILIEEFKADWKLKNSEGQTVSTDLGWFQKKKKKKKKRLLTNPISLFKNLNKRKKRMNTLSSLHT
jgi:hypothetical protein